MKDWTTDAQFLDSVDSKYLYRTSQIERFLKPESCSKFIIVASKGMGKTLLLRHKRKQIEDKKKRASIVIPKNTTADYVILPASISLDWSADPVFWEDIWKIAITISGLLHFPHDIAREELVVVWLPELERIKLVDTLKNELKNAISGKNVNKRNPSDVLDLLLQEGKKELERIRSSSLKVLLSMFSGLINNATYFFIDSFDQALNKVFANQLDIWCAAQIGLMKSAWELGRQNPHVKVFTSIRQEAYATFADGEVGNVEGNVLLLEYSNEDLEQILLTALKQFEGIDSVEAFFGFSKMYNRHLGSHEDVFKYVCRHTIGIPRWIIEICSRVSNIRKERGLIKKPKSRKEHQVKVAEIVNMVSAKQLACKHLKGEMKHFFKGGDPVMLVDNLLAKVNSTVVTFSTLRRISEKFLSDNDWNGTSHPFCLLYNMGLLGYVSETAGGACLKQVFKKPYEFIASFENTLPKDMNTYYLLHPSLHDLMKGKNVRFNFNKVKIGDGFIWSEKIAKKLEKEKTKIFISYSHVDKGIVKEIVDQMSDYLNTESILHDIWLDSWKMQAGKWIQDQMIEGIKDSDYLIFVVSSTSLRSAPVEVEWKTKFADKLSKGDDTVIPLIVDDTSFSELPGYLSQIYGYRYNGSSDEAIKLCKDILFWKNEVEC